MQHVYLKKHTDCHNYYELSTSVGFCRRSRVEGKISRVEGRGSREYKKIISFITWQNKSKRSDWFLLGRDFTIRTVSTEAVQAVYFFV